MKKSQVLSMTLFALLTLASVKTASSATPRSAQADSPAGTEIGLQDFLCNLSQKASTELPGLTPAPSLTSGGCGTCSQDICDNKAEGTFCGIREDTYGNFIYNYCLAPFANTCADGRARCYCQSEYQ
jgi:hypothetical protein